MASPAEPRAAASGAPALAPAPGGHGAPCAPCAGATGLFRVVGVLPYDMLAMRAGPGGDHAVVTRIPPRARRLAGLGPASGGWAPVRWDGRTGWVHGRHLAKDRDDEEATFRVSGIGPNDALEVRAGPSRGHAVVAALPPTAGGIVITDLRRLNWCRIECGRVSGWVEADHIEPEHRTPRPWST
jgi:uncharacterized protein YraI